MLPSGMGLLFAIRDGSTVAIRDGVAVAVRDGLESAWGSGDCAFQGAKLLSLNGNNWVKASVLY